MTRSGLAQDMVMSYNPRRYLLGSGIGIKEKQTSHSLPLSPRVPTLLGGGSGVRS